MLLLKAGIFLQSATAAPQALRLSMAVTGVSPNSRLNEPVSKGRPPADMLKMERADGIVVV